MHNFPVHKRIYYRWLGFVYGFARWTSQNAFIIRLSVWITLLAFVPLVVAWRQNQRLPIMIVALLPGLGILWLYWRARRVGYKRFVVGETAVSPTNLTPLPPNQRIPLKASGVFGVSNREEQILQQPAEYWQVPLGDHTVMAQPEPGRFLYQFFNAVNLQNLQTGWLLCGPTPQPVLAVTFYSGWGNDFVSLWELYQSTENENRETKRRTIYLHFEDENDQQAVWHTILHDARENRKE